MMSEENIKKWLDSLREELKSPLRDDIDRENIQDEINILEQVLEIKS